MEIKSCETCEFGIENTCSNRLCRDCPMNCGYGCMCNYIGNYGEDCPHYKKYEPTPPADEISSEE